MKKLLLVSSFLVAQQSFACVSAGSAYICNGDLVYKGANYSQGAKVVGENPYAGQVTVRSVSSGSLYTENVQELDVAQGCFGDFCVNDRVYKGSNYSQGASIIAINYIKQTLTLRSVSSG
ncbi:MAG: hypothetical protein K2Q18_00080, partial [Bdellovibrionales bacterium]|nr:hypothetical protein [Bdellovibrionales bacterium]